MNGPRSRFSRRHLLALCTFLVPLSVLAWLGQSELQRRGTQLEAAIEREAMQFVQSAARAIEQQLERELPRIDATTRELLADLGPVRTPLELRNRGDSPLLDVVLLDAQNALVWPTPPPPTIGLPLASDHQPRGEDGTIAAALRSADLLIARGDLATAADVLQELIHTFEQANPPSRGTRRDPDEAELIARFRLATVLRKFGETAAAKTQFEQVRNSVLGNSRRYDYETRAVAVLAEAAIAQTEPPAERLTMLRTIAESGRDSYAADGLLTAVAQRLAESIPPNDDAYPAGQTLLREAFQRAQSRTFAGDYELLLKESLRRRLRQSSLEGGGDESPVALVSTLDSTTVLFWVRSATAAERELLRAARVGLRIDLDQLLASVLPPFLGGDSTFVVTVHDPEGVPLVPAPSESVPGFTPPQLEVRGLTLRAYPSNAERRMAENAAEARTRAYLLAALFMTALGGALWLWRSVSREAELAALKVDLVSRVSHELKTPLALIRMYGETLGLGRAKDSEQAAHFGGIIARESERLTNLIQRILDFSRQQAGTLDYAPEPIDLGQLLQTVVDAYLPHLESRGVMLHETLPLGIWVTADANACESAIVNLLENAAKYGPDEDHEIELELRRTGELAVVEVRDRGRGIPPGEEQQIFEGFYRASNSGEVRGAGLGLSLVKHFAEAHGGTVSASRRDGGGSVFRLELPADVAVGKASTAS
ncbi:MAG: hypothetical protein RL398_1299 [Planctomycetota bacterium]|jgi:signal transduction histidine kinase